MDPRKPRQDPVNDARFYESLIKPPHLRTPDVSFFRIKMFSKQINIPL